MIVETVKDLVDFCGGDYYTADDRVVRVHKDNGECVFEMWEDEYINNVNVKEVFESIRETERKRIILKNAWLLF